MANSNPADAASGTPGAGAGSVPKSRGCLFWGCTTIVLVVLVVAVCLVWAMFSLYHEAEQYVTEEAVPVTAFEPASGQVAEVAERVEKFVDTARSEAPQEKASRVELSADDLNALLSAGDKPLGRSVYVQKIEDGKAWIELAVSLEGVPGFEGRYFNGTAIVKGIKRRGPSWVPEAESIRTKAGEEVSTRVIDALEVFMGPAIHEALSRVPEPGSGDENFYQRIFSERGDIRIEDGKIVLEVEAAPADQ